MPQSLFLEMSKVLCSFLEGFQSDKTIAHSNNEPTLLALLSLLSPLLDFNPASRNRLPLKKNHPVLGSAFWETHTKIGSLCEIE